MKESVAIAKDAAAKKESSPTKSDNSIQRLRNEPERQLGPMRDVIGNIRRNGGMPSVESISTELSVMPTSDRAPVLLALQQTHGNQYVQRVVTGIQAKLKIGQPNDIYEQEADRVAEQVMRMPEPEVNPEEEGEELIQTKPLAEQITPLVQRQVEPEEEEEEEEILQTKEVLGQTPEVIPDLESRINSIRGGGQPLPESVRDFFEPFFGYDFSQVRVHNDARAVESASALNAQAFTLGRDVVFGAGHYAPSTTSGKRLLAHELTHVVQQSHIQSDNSTLQRDELTGTPTLESPLPSHLRFTYLDFLRMQEERFALIYRYMEENRTHLRSLSEWVAAVRRDVPEAVDIPRAEIELAVRQGAEQYSINILALPPVPQPAGGVTEEQPSGESLANAVRDLKDQLEDLVETLTTYGNPERIEVTLGFSGIETALERSGFRFSWTVGWQGQLGARVSHMFNGELSLSINSDWIAPEDNPTFSATLQFGPSEPNYARLHEIFNNAGITLTNYIRGLIEESRGVSNEQISETETSIEDMISRISDAVAMAPDEEEEFPPVTFSFQVGYGAPSLLPSEEGRPEIPAGFYVQGFLTLHF
jgi:hypothetical protein